MAVAVLAQLAVPAQRPDRQTDWAVPEAPQEPEMKSKEFSQLSEGFGWSTESEIPARRPTTGISDIV
jgi:hypothetical protein